MTDFISPVGRMVQGSVTIQHQKDQQTNQLKYIDAQGNKCAANAPGAIPEMGVFFACAYPKVLPNGQANSEFDAFHTLLKQTAAAAWPGLFPQGPMFPCTNPKFSWKYQDGDGVDSNGQPVNTKPGFAGHHIIKFGSKYTVDCYNEGQFAKHQVLQNPETIIKRGYWVRVVGETKSNNATGTQVPGIAVYVKFVSFVEKGEEISSGPDAQESFGKSQVGWRPPATSSPVPTPNSPAANGGGLPVPPKVGGGQPQMPQVQRQPVLVLAPHHVASGFTLEGMRGQGWTDETMVANGHAFWQ